VFDLDKEAVLKETLRRMDVHIFRRRKLQRLNLRKSGFAAGLFNLFQQTSLTQRRAVQYRKCEGRTVITKDGQFFKCMHCKPSVSVPALKHPYQKYYSPTPGGPAQSRRIESRRIAVNSGSEKASRADTNGARRENKKFSVKNASAVAFWIDLSYGDHD
jgi:hypothetical protein